MIRKSRLRSLSPKRQAEGARSSLTPSPGPTRRAWINRTVKQRKPRKALPKNNPARQAKVAKRSKAKHTAYMASETRKIVDRRAKGQCERTTLVEFGAGMGQLEYRCSATEGLEHHHKTYARYGGNELPGDMLKVCPRCHEYLESLKPAGNRRSRAATLTGERT